MASVPEVLEEIRRIFRAELELDRDVRPEEELLSGLELDSLALTVLAVGLENRFRVKIPDEQAISVRTVEDLAGLVSRLTQEQ